MSVQNLIPLGVRILELIRLDAAYGTSVMVNARNNISLQVSVEW
jgi:hypothetical protein